MTKVSDVIKAIEAVAPLRYQDEWDNSGLQVGFPEDEVRGVLVCLDVTEAIVDEAVRKGCSMIVSHHPLLFRGLKQVCDLTYQQRCVTKALRAGIAIYSAHTSLDNAAGGVNHKIAELIGLEKLEWLEPKWIGEACGGEGGCEGCSCGCDGQAPAGSGLIGELPGAVQANAFLDALKATFRVESLRHSDLRENTTNSGATKDWQNPRAIKKVALCGGAGAFLMPAAKALKADCFITGEFHYHDYFENDGMLLAELGHYQSEKCTIDLLKEIIGKSLKDVNIISTEINTNPINYR